MKKRLGFMGLAFWYEAFSVARAARENDKVQIVAAADTDEERLKRFTAIFGMRGYSDHKKFLEKENLDIVMIAPPTIDRTKYALEAADFGCHMIIAARISMDINETTRLVDAIRGSGLKVVICDAEAMFDDSDTKRKIDSGLIGKIVHVRSVSHASLPEDWFVSGKTGWFTDPKQVLGGAFFDYGIYCVDALRWFVGDEIKEINYARIQNLIHKRLPVEDWGFAFFTFGKGVTGTIEASWDIVTPQKTKPSPKRNSYKQFEIIGTRGRIITDILPIPHEMILSDEHPYWALLRSSRNAHHVGVDPPSNRYLPYILECIERDEIPKCSVEDASKNLQFMLAFYEAARTNSPVKLPVSV
jgi:predicted dehydrogenase